MRLPRKRRHRVWRAPGSVLAGLMARFAADYGSLNSHRWDVPNG